ncbi:hypothetical protein [Streptomyces sp. NPDC047108]|uniref:hypothetical protein n=1 Tax=Streptomyces sp. NPDC047108 TaxID=3155025 RepID=UPI0033F31175
MSFLQYLKQAAERTLEAFPEDLRSEIYVVSFRIWRTDGDARCPYVAIGYNTESQYRQELNSEPGRHLEEARWNYAYWLLEGFGTLGNTPDDPTGAQLYVDEVKGLGLWYDDAAEISESEQEGLDEQLAQHFADVCVDTARHLHSSGCLKHVMGRRVPIVIFDMDCPGWEVGTTEAANPPEAVADFLAYFRA